MWKTGREAASGFSQVGSRHRSIGEEGEKELREVFLVEADMVFGLGRSTEVLVFEVSLVG